MVRLTADLAPVLTVDVRERLCAITGARALGLPFDLLGRAGTPELEAISAAVR